MKTKTSSASTTKAKEIAIETANIKQKAFEEANEKKHEELRDMALALRSKYKKDERMHMLYASGPCGFLEIIDNMGKSINKLEKKVAKLEKDLKNKI
jgi:hypothetical protein